LPFYTQVLNAVGAAFVFTSPTGLGQNAFYWEDFDGGIMDTKELEICFEKSGAVTSVHYMVNRNSPTMMESAAPSADLGIKTVFSTAGAASKPADARPSVMSSEMMPQGSSDLQLDPTPLGIQLPVEAHTPVGGTNSMPRSASLSSPLQGQNGGQQRIECDFSSLVPGDFVTSSLRETCFMEITTFRLDGSSPASGGAARVLDSSNPSKESKQLGSPNQDCPGNSGPGQGSGGSPLHQATQAYQNCVARGNVLIVPERSDHNADENDPIPAATGGCIIFRFVVPVFLHGAGVLDIPPRTTVMYTVRTTLF
jgi:hypothetical protein